MQARPGLIVVDVRGTAVERLTGLQRLAGLASLSLNVSPALQPHLTVVAFLSRLIHLRVEPSATPKISLSSFAFV